VDPPSPWLVYATPSVAVLALVVAIASFVVALITYRRAGPRVKVWFVIEEIGTFKSESAPLLILLKNRGLAPVDIDSFLLEAPFLRGLANTKLFFLDDSPRLVHGETLPATLAPNSSLSWVYDIQSLGYGPRQTTEPATVSRRLRATTLVVQLGSGRVVRKMRINFGLFERFVNRVAPSE